MELGIRTRQLPSTNTNNTENEMNELLQSLIVYHQLHVILRFSSDSDAAATPLTSNDAAILLGQHSLLALLRRRLNQSSTLNGNLDNDAERGEEMTTSGSTTTSRSVQTSNDNKNEKIVSNNADNMAIKSPPSKKRTRTKNEESAHSTRPYRQKIAHNESCKGGSTNTKKASYDHPRRIGSRHWRRKCPLKEAALDASLRKYASE